MMKVKEATSPEELQQAYRIRYSTLTRELGDQRYADHEQQLYSDPWDKPPSRVFLGMVDGFPAGTVRYILKREMSFPAQEIYDFDELSKASGLPKPRLLENVALLDRGGVSRAFRRAGVFAAMHDELLAIGSSTGIQIHVGLVSSGNDAMCRVLNALDWRMLPAPVVYRTWSGYCHYRMLS